MRTIPTPQRPLKLFILASPKPAYPVSHVPLSVFLSPAFWPMLVLLHVVPPWHGVCLLLLGTTRITMFSQWQLSSDLLVSPYLNNKKNPYFRTTVSLVSWSSPWWLGSEGVSSEWERALGGGKLCGILWPSLRSSSVPRLLHCSLRQCQSPIWVQAGLGKRLHLLMGSGKVTGEHFNGNIVVASLGKYSTPNYPLWAELQATL